MNTADYYPDLDGGRWCFVTGHVAATLGYVERQVGQWCLVTVEDRHSTADGAERWINLDTVLYVDSTGGISHRR